MRWRLATTFGARLRGLLGRPPLAPGEALWIAPCKAVHTFGMRHALDVAFIDRHGRIVRIVPELRPWRIAFCPAAAAVAEARAGESVRGGWRHGMALRPPGATPAAGGPPDASFTLPDPPMPRPTAVKLFSDQDLSWGAFIASLAIMFVAVNAFRGPLPDGPIEARLPLLLQYLGAFMASVLFGCAIVAIIWAVRRFTGRGYPTPRRDLAVAILLMMLVTFRSNDASAQPTPAMTQATPISHPTRPPAEISSTASLPTTAPGWAPMSS
ncbi:hypothetical protein GCM10023144_30650 [Pigmentiphaga soli]|uniref:DUF192 domain-containing protein n=1 Tax=Pigmentiphaga soli TaxID=1007095 RepID=A0ABP8H9W5_9BURK